LYESGAQPVGYRGAEVPGVGGDHKRPARVERQPSSASRYTAGPACRRVPSRRTARSAM
jgi:hypothetical protein